jgi:PD-(D/E)XK endonuclease
MASLKMKGDLAELEVATDLLGRGYKIAIPYGEDWDFDLIFERDGQLERVRVEYTRSNGEFVAVRCRSHSLTNGRVRRTKHYTAAMIELAAVYDEATDRCYYAPATELGRGKAMLHLRLQDPLNAQRVGIRFASGPRGSAAATGSVPTFVPWHPKHAPAWSQRDSNPRPPGCKPDALPTELWPQQGNSTADPWPIPAAAPGRPCPSPASRRAAALVGGWARSLDLEDGDATS